MHLIQSQELTFHLVLVLVLALLVYTLFEW